MWEVHTNVQVEVRGQFCVCKKWFSPYTMSILEIKLGSLGWYGSTRATEPSPGPAISAVKFSFLHNSLVLFLRGYCLLPITSVSANFQYLCPKEPSHWHLTYSQNIWLTTATMMMLMVMMRFPCLSEDKVATMWASFKVLQNVNEPFVLCTTTQHEASTFLLFLARSP